MMYQKSYIQGISFMMGSGLSLILNICMKQIRGENI